MPESRNDNSAPEKRAHNSHKEKKQPSLVGLGVDLARCQQLTDQHSAAFPLLERILQQRKLLQESYEQISLSDKPELVQTHAAEWLLDNFYLVEETFQQIDEDFPKSFYKRLPLLDNTELKSYPRVFGIAWSLVHQVSFNPSYDQIKSFLNAYQKVQVLKIGEVWAVPVMLRIAILEILAQEMSEITGIDLPEFVIQMELSGGERQQSAIVASCIQGLSTLKIIDWKRLFEDVSRVERVLKQDPDQVYVAMDFETRDQYRKAVEQLSDRSGIPEDKVAEQAIQLAQAAHARYKDTPDPTLRIQKHVGYYLVERGLPRLREEIDYQPGLNERFGSWVRQHAFPLYVSSIGTATVILIALLLVYLASIQASLLQLAVALFLSILPASTIAVSLVNTIITLMVSPRPPLARLDFSKGVPEDCRTLVVIPALLTNSQGVDALLRQLELYYLGNGAEQIFFALLTDLEDAAQQRLPEDEGLVEQVIAGINSLNERYPKELGSNFYLFHRDRKWNPVEEVWMGWERKRGKLSELNHFLRGDQANHFSQVIGETRILEGSKYVITLDEDTFLPNNAARELIGIMAHPFNCPQFDPQSDQVVAGYTFLQPRVEVKPESAQRTRFTRIYVGEGGIDLYSQTVSNVYQDLFGEGSYMGKGIYDVDAYLRTLEGKIPENAVLSHDLLEGLYGRAGLVTDVVLYESFPLYYLAYTQRIHRWMRGDWQLLSWLLPFTRRKKLSREENTLSALDIWKLADNLRRSLTFPGVLAFLVLGWLLSPVSAVLWTVAGLMPLAVPVFSGMIPVIWFSFSSDTLVTGWLSMRRDLALWLLNIVFLPYQSLLALDAIGATLVRLFITHKHLLQWTTAAHTIQVMDKEFKVEISWGRMRSAVIFALVVAAMVGMLQPTNLLLIAPILFMWLISPQIAYWISQHITHDKEEITLNERRELRRLARRTWHFFEQFVGPEDNWLPPDHFQEDPRGTVAHRTSPTNIGLGLLSDLSAYDLGYIGVWELSVRLQNTFNALHSLEKYNGHLLNWYQTQNLKPLLPRYVSTVDSGNFAGSLLALRQACQEVCHAPVFRAERWQGLLDTLDLLNITLVSTEMPSQTKKLLSLLDEIKQDIQRSVEQPGKWLATLKEIAEKKWTKLDQQMRELISLNSLHLESEELHSLRVWTERTHQHIVSMLRTMDRLLPWLDEMEDAPWKDDNFTAKSQISTWESLLEVFPGSATLVEISSVCEKGLDTLREFQDSLARGNKSGSAQVIEEWCNQFSERLLATQQQVQDLLGSFHELQVQSEEFFEAMDFSFLFNETRNIFRIGYNVDTGRLDGNHYDLLASEARLASFLAIAKGDVPQKHWLYLGRPLTKTGEGLALLSWSGSMFEYLMPHLLMKQYPQTLLQLTCKTIVEKQIDYAKSQHVPWGISESGYYHFDASRNYQYRAFGVPGLGLKRGLDVDLVITPYASILALDVDSKGVLDNLSRLADLNMLDRYGFYEAIDYTKSRLP
ncbi:MAG: glucoamylase family protein, partial [Anaerolineales bacterium]